MFGERKDINHDYTLHIILQIYNQCWINISISASGNEDQIVKL